jgi:hypothetical protein
MFIKFGEKLKYFIFISETINFFNIYNLEVIYYILIK